jgi:hypothetical protein
MCEKMILYLPEDRRMAGEADVRSVTAKGKVRAPGS